MSALCDHEIKALCEHGGMINPWVNGLVTEGVISYGLSSFGYDARLATEFKTPRAHPHDSLDPKNVRSEQFNHFSEPWVMIPTGSFVLGRTIEHFKIPLNVIAVCVGKSTYARCGINVLTTPLEPGWQGHVTLEIVNNFPYPVKVYAEEGICQFIFFRGAHPSLTYGSRKYQNQRGVTLAKV